MRDARTRRGMMVLSVAIAAGCTEPTGYFPPPAEAVVRVLVRHVEAGPLAGAEVQASSRIGHRCQTDVSTLTAVPSPATTDADGVFTLHLFNVGGTGTHCVDLTVTDAPRALVDTVRDVRVEFRLEMPPSDTADIEITVGG